MTAKDFSRKVRAEKLYEKAKKTLCGYSDGSIFLDGDLDVLEENAKKEGLEIYILKDNRSKKKKEPEKSE